MSLYESRRTFPAKNASHLLPLSTMPAHDSATTRRRLTMQQLSLVILVIQNSVLVLVMRQSRRPADAPLMYLASTAVFGAEVIKLVCCTGMLYWTTTTDPFSVAALGYFMKHQVYDLVMDKRGLLLMMIPSGLYALQNNLLYVALSHLEAATFQVTYQLKILSTALFSMLLLDRHLTRQQWAALVLLMAGVTMVQLSTVATTTTTEEVGEEDPSSVTWIGLMAVLASCVSSGFAGCYFERLLKSRSSGPPLSIWVRNIHLGICGSLFSFVGMVIYDRQRILDDGFFQGYDGTTYWVIMNQALGGLVVSMVMKYADNILKAFATSLSIILSSVISVYLFDFRPSLSFIVGTCTVLLSTYLYSRPNPTFKPD